MGSKMNSSTFLGAYVLREMGHNEEADEIMKEWLRESKGDKIARWAMAAYNNDYSQAAKLAEKMKTTEDGTPWNPGRNEAAFDLIKEIFILLNSKSEI
jgi:hypothetical protein